MSRFNSWWKIQNQVFISKFNMPEEAREKLKQLTQTAYVLGYEEAQDIKVEEIIKAMEKKNGKM